MDQYINDTNALTRLIYEYRRYKTLVIAYDYDDTVFDYHKRGYSYEMVINLIRRCKKVGFDLVVFTYSEESRYPEIKEYLDSNNIPYNRINSNPDFSNKDSKKIFYNHLLDDRSGLKSSYDTLNTLVNIVELEQKSKIKQRTFKRITLCGSTKFKDQFLAEQKRLTLEGNIVISVGLFGHSGDNEVWAENTKEMLDEMHKCKIDMADEIFVINVGGYIGQSTKNEIEYAKSIGKRVFYLEHRNL